MPFIPSVRRNSVELVKFLRTTKAATRASQDLVNTRRSRLLRGHFEALSPSPRAALVLVSSVIRWCKRPMAAIHQLPGNASVPGISARGDLAEYDASRMRPSANACRAGAALDRNQLGLGSARSGADRSRTDITLWGESCPQNDLSRALPVSHRHNDLIGPRESMTTLDAARLTSVCVLK